jgi:hypothetical protein
LADIYVGAGVISISQSAITDLRLNTELCGIVHGTVEQVDTTTLFNQYLTWLQEKKNQYNQDMLAWTAQKKSEFEIWAEAQEQGFEAWRAQEEQSFYAWLEYLQDILDENVAGNLLNLIETHVNDKNNPHNVTPEQIGAETPTGAQAKVEAAAGAVQAKLDAHLAENAIHKTSDVIRTETNTQLKVEVVSSSVSETPDAGRIIFDTSQGKFFGGNGTEWV